MKIDTQIQNLRVIQNGLKKERLCETKDSDNHTMISLEVQAIENAIDTLTEYRLLKELLKKAIE